MNWQEFQALKLGVYRLTRDVTNPKPDRRTRHDWRYAPVIREGSIVRVVDWPLGGDSESVRAIEPVAVKADNVRQTWAHQTLRSDSPLSGAIVEAMRRHDMSDAEWIDDLSDGQCRRALLALMRTGKIVRADAASVLAEEESANV